MSDMAIPSVLPAATAAKADTPEKVRDAAQQFEALLMGQILRSARQGGSGWLGGEDSSAECATDYAEQQLAAVLARQGGLGLAGLIAKGLEHNR
jgi:flagellar protein FlgJ